MSYFFFLKNLDTLSHRNRIQMYKPSKQSCVNVIRISFSTLKCCSVVWSRFSQICLHGNEFVLIISSVFDQCSIHLVKLEFEIQRYIVIIVHLRIWSVFISWGWNLSNFLLAVFLPHLSLVEDMLPSCHAVMSNCPPGDDIGCHLLLKWDHTHHLCHRYQESEIALQYSFTSFATAAAASPLKRIFTRLVSDVPPSRSSRPR